MPKSGFWLAGLHLLLAAPFVLLGMALRFGASPGLAWSQAPQAAAAAGGPSVPIAEAQEVLRDVEELSAEELEALARRLLAPPRSRINEKQLDRVARALGKLGAGEAVDRLRQLGGPWPESEFLQAWLVADSTAARSWLRGKNATHAQILDAAEALGATDFTPWASNDPGFGMGPLGRLAAKLGPVEAQAKLSILPFAFRAEVLRWAVREITTKQSLADAQAWIAALPSAQSRLWASSALHGAAEAAKRQQFQAALRADPAAAVAEWAAEKSPDKHAPSTELQNGELNHAALWQAGHSLPAGPDRDILLNQLTRWAPLDRLLGWESQVEPAVFGQLQERLLLELPADDAYSRLAAWEAHNRPTPGGNVLWQLCDKDPVRFREFARGLAEGKTRQTMLRIRVERSVRAEPDAVWKEVASDPATFGPIFVNAHPLDPRSRQWAVESGDAKALRRVAEALLRRDTAQGIAFLAETQHPDAPAILQSRAEHANGSAGVFFLQALPPHLAKPEFYTPVARNWLGTDPEAASTWANQLPPGPSRDAAVDGLVSGLLGSAWDPEAALRWASTVADAAKREALQTKITHIWSQIEPTIQP